MFEMANRKAVMKDTKIDVTTENQVFLNSSIAQQTENGLRSANGMAWN